MAYMFSYNCGFHQLQFGSMINHKGTPMVALGWISASFTMSMLLKFEGASMEFLLRWHWLFDILQLPKKPG
jgi:hypothetical protein